MSRPHESSRSRCGSTTTRGRYLLHCHTLEHEDMGMMAAFRTA